jgi:hypothetical protein
VFAVLGIFAAFGWLLNQDIAHAVGFVAAALLAFVLSTIPVGRVP